ncbi:hypothetical protein [Natrinema hispanicum]|uniref:Uncharacterized protein n=1 Tax=Natrinema hispanicum TaxID=392421 RepID=A0A1G6RGR8_9EURY|nr:hypothetical protein [Natrinema hispanicum]SDD03116.1 hypothetical protein SAMN05192552_101140 [Natrinema hispanicum]SET54316.1 hypothetical protein SAMN04488694_10840 [Natrinema hispanicum]
MNRRTAGVIIGMLTVVCLGLVFSIVYPPSTTELDYRDPFTSPETSEYELSGEIVVDGELLVELEATVTANGSRYRSIGSDEDLTESYQESPGEDKYIRMKVRDGSVDQRIEQIENDDDRKLIREDRADEEVILVILENTTEDQADNIITNIELFTNVLQSTKYRQVDETAENRVYEPQDGWFGGHRFRPYRITDSAGQVIVDKDSYEVKSANVSWDRTSDTETYAQYLINRVIADETETIDLRFESDTDVAETEVPQWVENAQEEAK